MSTGSRCRRTQKAYTLDALRATAALLVLMLHIAPLAKPLGCRHPVERAWARSGVHLFFVLSGYLITSAVLSRSYTPRRYALNRAFRILPAYFVAHRGGAVPPRPVVPDVVGWPEGPAGATSSCSTSSSASTACRSTACCGR